MCMCVPVFCVYNLNGKGKGREGKGRRDEKIGLCCVVVNVFVEDRVVGGLLHLRDCAAE